MNTDALIAVDDLPRKMVETPEWADAGFAESFVRTMGTEERILLKNFHQDPDGKESEDLEEAFVYRFAALMLCDKEGVRLFDDSHLDALKHKNPEVLKRIGEAAEKHNGIGKKSQQDAVENSEADTTSDDT